MSGEEFSDMGSDAGSDAAKAAEEAEMELLKNAKKSIRSDISGVRTLFQNIDKYK